MENKTNAPRVVENSRVQALEEMLKELRERVSSAEFAVLQQLFLLKTAKKKNFASKKNFSR